MPDEGNMHTIELVVTGAQKEECLEPLVAAEVNSAFSMTEPRMGGDSDLKMWTTAENDGDKLIIGDHKWWTTQGSEDVFIVMA